MKLHSFLITLTAASLGALSGCNRETSSTTSVPSNSNNPPAATKPDNTAMNKMDRDTAAKTPMDQGENSPDIRITADIRKAVMDDKSLSTDAHNAKIITDKGNVTLRGVVDNVTERDSLEAKAKAVNGVANVDNQLEVKSAEVKNQ